MTLWDSDQNCQENLIGKTVCYVKKWRKSYWHVQPSQEENRSQMSVLQWESYWKNSTKLVFYQDVLTIFKPKFNFFEILKANMVKNPERVMTI